MNQQTNEVNLGGSPSNLSRDSRERVKSAVLGLLSSLTNQPVTEEDDANVITVEPVEELSQEEDS